MAKTAKKREKTTTQDYDGSTSLNSVLMEKFIANIVLNGLNPTQAYKEAGYKASNDNSVNAASSRLLKNVKIIARKTHLERQQKAEQVDEREKSIKVLTQIRDDPTVSARDKVSATKELGAICGWHSQTITHETDARQRELDERERRVGRLLSLRAYNPHLLDGEVSEADFVDNGGDNDDFGEQSNGEDM